MVSNTTLVTGASGYIGRRLVARLLDRNQPVGAFLRHSTDLDLDSNSQLKVFLGDITDPSAIEQAVAECRQVYHLAALVDLWHRHPQEFTRVNVEGTKRLLAACLRYGVRRVLICSSCGIFGPAVQGRLIDENKRIQVEELGPYERSKNVQRELALGYNCEAMQVILVYPTRVFGPGPKRFANHVTHLLRNAVLHRRCFVPGDGRSLGNYVFVEDVVQGMIQAMDLGKPGEGYIVGGINLNYLELVQYLERVIQQSISVWQIPKLVLRIAAVLEMFRSSVLRARPKITQQVIAKYTSDWPVSINKAQTELGYQPTDFESALRLTLADIMSNEPGKPQP